MFIPFLFTILASVLTQNYVEAKIQTDMAIIGGGMGMGGMGMGGMGMGGMGMGMGGFGMDQSMFNGGKKNFNDMFYNQKGGNQGGMFDQGSQGFQAGEGMKKMLNGQQGAFNAFKGKKNMMQNGMGYQGGNKFGKQGKKGDQKKMQEGHKKGHGVKSFKTSHQKDENSATEEFYDEEHDEGEHKGSAGQQGQFGENKGAGFKGGKGEAEYKAGEAKKAGQFGEKYLKGIDKGQGGQYGNKNYAGGQAGYMANTEGDLKKGEGHEQAENMFKHYKHPYMMMG